MLKFFSSNNFLRIDKTLIKEIGLESASLLALLQQEYNNLLTHLEYKKDSFTLEKSYIKNTLNLDENCFNKALKKLLELGIIEAKNDTYKLVDSKKYLLNLYR